jgi:hypothetical protein
MALKDIQMYKQGTAGNRQHVTLTIPHKPETIRRHEICESREDVRALYDTASLIVYDVTKTRDNL